MHSSDLRSNYRHGPRLGRDRDLSESEIRTVLVQSFKHREAVLIEEFPASGGRLDLLTISGELLTGFEIKSDFDSLHRVDAQIAAFSQYCDILTFVAGRRLVLLLLRSLPIWCGVSLAYRTSDQRIKLLPLRYPLMNPFVCAKASLSLLRRDELLTIASSRCQVRLGRKALQDLLLAGRSFGELRKHLSAALTLRERHRVGEPRRLGDDLSLPEANSQEFLSVESGVP